ncbi:MAG TPA: ribosome-associated translation inhibitor RaiA [Pyrinomonadaceae bacterium]|jgi:putative sigma-54 modulation protein|nr:ribosome-associated translation inhibitor RaiA [Pyrinomonadaceae bacterium]
MEIEYTGRHIEVTPAIRTHVEEHFRKLDHLFDGSSSASAHVIIEVNKNRHVGEVLVHWRNHTMTATDTNADMYQALSRAIAKIEKQAVKLKKKIVERKKGAKPLSSLAPSNEPGDEPTDGQRDLAPPVAGRIINARRYTVKPMTAEEAALRLSGEADQFLVFRDSDTQRISVLYKRNDGNYGLIQP